MRVYQVQLGAQGILVATKQIIPNPFNRPTPLDGRNGPITQARQQNISLFKVVIPDTNHAELKFNIN